MKIVYDYNVFGWQHFGGITRYFCEIAQRIGASAVHDVRVVAPLFVNRYLASARPSIRVMGRFVPDMRNSRVNRLANRLISKPLLIALRPHLVHETYYSQASVVPTQSRRVVTVFDMIHELFPEDFGAQDRTAEIKRMAVQRADHVICISAQTKTDLVARYDLDPANVSVIHLAASLTHVTCAQLPDNLSKPYLLYVGARAGYKNFSGLVAAFASSRRLKRDVRLVAFGSGAFNAEERRLLTQLRLTGGEVVQVAGDDGVLRALYESASAFVYPSLYEGFGIPPLEAMSVGCPVVCSDAGSIPEVVGGAGQMFDPRDPQAMAAALEAVVYDPSLREALIARGHARQRLFSWERCASETLDIYTRVGAR